MSERVVCNSICWSGNIGSGELVCCIIWAYLKGNSDMLVDAWLGFQVNLCINCMHTALNFITKLQYVVYLLPFWCHAYYC